MTTIKSKRIALVLLFCSILFANYSNSTPQKNVSPIKIVGTTWKVPIKDHFSYIVFNLDSTFVYYARETDQFFYGNYNVKDGRVILHLLKGEFDNEFPEGSIHRTERRDYFYRITDNEMYPIDDKGKVTGQEGGSFKPASKDWTPPPR